MKTDIDFTKPIILRKHDNRIIVQRPSGPWDVWGGTDYADDVKEYLAETPKALIDEPLPPDPTQEEKDSQEIRKINMRFDAITLASVRPLRAIQLGADTVEDSQKLMELDAEVATLRKRLATLEGNI